MKTRSSTRLSAQPLAQSAVPPKPTPGTASSSDTGNKEVSSSSDQKIEQKEYDRSFKIGLQIASRAKIITNDEAAKLYDLFTSHKHALSATATKKHDGSTEQNLDDEKPRAKSKEPELTTEQNLEGSGTGDTKDSSSIASTKIAVPTKLASKSNNDWVSFARHLVDLLLVVSEEQANTSNTKIEKKKRGSYNCGICGKPKKDHICDFKPVHIPQSFVRHDSTSILESVLNEDEEQDEMKNPRIVGV